MTKSSTWHILSPLLAISLALACNTGPAGSPGPGGPPGPQGNPGVQGAPGEVTLELEDGGSLSVDAGVVTFNFSDSTIAIPGGGKAYKKTSDNGTATCDAYCSDYNGSWLSRGPSGTCVAARILLGGGTTVSSSLQGKYLPCSQLPQGTVTNWNLSVDQVLCWCVNFP